MKPKKAFQKFLLLWSGEFISAIGNGLTSFGLGVYVYQQTGKASAMALVTLLAFLPSLLLSAPAGVLADRYDRRLMMILGDGLSAIGLLYILVCMLSGEARLWQICVGVTISSVFSSLMEPAYKATVTDLLSEEQYTKASGLVQITGSAKYLISPMLAGYLLAISDITLLLIIDICTLLVTVATTYAVRAGLAAKKREQSGSFFYELKQGWRALSQKRGLLMLVIIASFITFFMGFIQTLSTPMALAFTNTTVLGVIETVSASGMLVTSVLIGIFSIRTGYVRALSASLFGAGVFMALFGLRENIALICVAGFLFFAMLPFANTCLDFLIRTNIENDLQGRAWGLVGIISQLGYVAAYALSGMLADYIFTPLLLPGGALAATVGSVMGVGSGRGAGFLILVAGVLMCVTAAVLCRAKQVRALEQRGEARTAA